MRVPTPGGTRRKKGFGKEFIKVHGIDRLCRADLLRGAVVCPAVKEIDLIPPHDRSGRLDTFAFKGKFGRENGLAHFLPPRRTGSTANNTENKSHRDG